jgi:ribonuclease HI
VVQSRNIKSCQIYLIAFAEIAAALPGLIYTAEHEHQPTKITIATDSAVAYYTLATGKGATFRYNVLLQELYVTFFRIKSDRGHHLVVRWVPSGANLADPVSRGVLAQDT